jgi:xylulokinase
MDPDARGAFVGLAAPHTRAHLARAAVEGVAFALRDCLEALRTLGVAPARLLLAGGVARHPLWPRVLADALGVPILTGGDEHGSARGAARLAARGAADVAPRAAPARTRTDPDPAAAAAYERLYALYRPLYAALRPIATALAGQAAAT